MQSPSPTSWSTEDFEHLSWHDNHIHAFRIVEGSDGSGELVLDIDHILQWIPGNPTYSFQVAPAVLTFHEVFALRVLVDYTVPSAAIGPASIHEITREPQGLWRIVLNWPSGEISFTSPGFTLRLSGPVVETCAQHLSPEERVHCGGI
jgi:hypothetical protein